MGGRGGGGVFNNQTGPILVHIYPLLNNNVHVQYRSNLIRTLRVQIQFFFGVMLGPYIKSRGTRVTGMSANADLTTVETYVQQVKGKQFENQFFIYGPKCYFFIVWAIWGALRGFSIIRIGLYSFPAISHPYLCTCQIRKQSDKEFLSLNPKYDFCFFIFGGSWGPLTSNLGEQNCQGSKTSSHSSHIYV